MAETIETMSYCELRQKARELARRERIEREGALWYAAEGLGSSAADCLSEARTLRRERARIERRLARMEHESAPMPIAKGN